MLTHIKNLVFAVLVFGGGLIENTVCAILGAVAMAYYLHSGYGPEFVGALIGVGALLIAISLLKVLIGVQSVPNQKTIKESQSREKARSAAPVR